MAGYFRPPVERPPPPANNMSFQRPAPNNVPSGAPISGDLNIVYLKSLFVFFSFWNCASIQS